MLESELKNPIDFIFEGTSLMLTFVLAHKNTYRKT